MADILHEEILNFRVQSCPRVGGQCPPPFQKWGAVAPSAPPPPSPTPLHVGLSVLVKSFLSGLLLFGHLPAVLAETVGSIQWV